MEFPVQKKPQKHKAFADVRHQLYVAAERSIDPPKQVSRLRVNTASRLLDHRSMAHGNGSSSRWPYRRGIAPLFHNFGIVFFDCRSIISSFCRKCKRKFQKRCSRIKSGASVDRLNGIYSDSTKRIIMVAICARVALPCGESNV